MRLLVGLGNPGAKYAMTRHNAGFVMADLLADQFQLSWGGQKFEAEYASGSIWGEKVVLLKPLTFMNLSGRSVAQAMRFFKLEASQLIVLHDDIDLAAGTVKVRAGGGHGGHNGIRSIIAETGESDFFRIKLGVGRPDKGASGDAVTHWVLGAFSPGELEDLQKSMLDAVVLRLKNILQEQAQ